MDVLKPDMEVIDGIRYRINPGNHGGFSKKNDSYEEDSVHIDIVRDVEDDILECDNFQEIEGGRFKLSFHVAAIYFPYIIGSKGATKKRLENETNTKITIPKLGLDGNIDVTGADKRSVSSAKNRILMMAASCRRRHRFTHFISIPMNTLSFKNGLLKFKEDVLNNIKGRGIDESIFQNPEKLHITVCMLVLGDNLEVQEAAAALQRCKEEVISPMLQSNRPLQIKMVGVDYMNDDPTNIEVLYGKVSAEEDPDILQRLCDEIVNYFDKLGLIDREKEHCKLHVTLMNTKFREDEDSSKGRKKRDTFDGSQIISTFDNFFFGSDFVTEIHISMLNTPKVENGYYQSSSQIALP